MSEAKSHTSKISFVEMGKLFGKVRSLGINEHNHLADRPIALIALNRVCFHPRDVRLWWSRLAEFVTFYRKG